MDIEKIVSELAAKLTGDSSLLKEFAANPVKTLETKLGVDLPDEQIHAVVSGLMSKLNLGDLGSAAKTATGLMSKLKGFFGK